MKERIALDASPSVRSKDENGFLHVAVSNLTKEIVNPYYGREIPGWQDRGIDPDRVYYGYRSGAELEKGASTFSGLPLLLDHHLEDAEAPQKDFRVGTVGTDARWEAPYVKAALVVTDADAIRAIEDGSMRELSCAYRYDPLWQAGTFDGIEYDFVMTNIRGNHVALVSEGRAGADVVVADAAPKAAPRNSKCHHKVEGIMKLFKKRFGGALDSDPATEKQEVDLAQALLDLHKLNPETGELLDIAEDEEKAAAVKAAVDSIVGKLDPEEVGALVDAVEAFVAPAEPAADECGDPVKDEEAEAPASDEDETAPAADEDAPAEAAQDEDEPAQDEDETASDEDETAVDEDAPAEGAAMDAALRKVFSKAVKAAEARTVRRFRELSAAAEAVRPVLGAVDPLAFDTASGIYGAALRKLGIDVRKHPRSAWPSMYAVARKSAAMAQDAAGPAPMPKGFEGVYAGLNRIKRG